MDAEGGGERPGVVLLVDDEPDNLEVFRFNFDADFTAHTAASGHEGLEILSLHPVEVVVADQRMPEMTGLEMLERVRDHHPHVHRILLTAHTNEDLLVEAINRQVLHRFISKPWRYESMVAVIRGAIDHHRLSTRNADLERRVGQAGHLALLGELASALVHDLNQPLQVIETGLFTAREIIDGGLATIGREMEDLVGAIGDADTAIDHLRRLSTTIRGLMRERPARLAEVPLGQVVEDTMSLLRHQVRQKEVELSTRVDHGLPAVLADPVQIAQVLLNLTGNACDALEGQEVRQLSVGVELGNDGAQALVVSDTGPGIPPDVQARMFEPFFTTKADGKGTGLGLAIVRRIIQSHHADFQIESKPGEGTTMRVIFPPIEVVRANTMPISQGQGEGAEADKFERGPTTVIPPTG